jgi:hypothetical protein
VTVRERVARVEVDDLVSEDARCGDERREHAVSDECDEHERADGECCTGAGSGLRLGDAFASTFGRPFQAALVRDL